MPVLGRCALRVIASSVPGALRRTIHHRIPRATSTTLGQSFVAQRCIRWLSTPAPHINESNISVERYHELSESTMDSLLEHFEEILDNVGKPDHEVEYHGGVLTLTLGSLGTYVINKQPPNKQIWLSSPFSGPKRYDYSEEEDDWIYLRDGGALGDLLNRELTEALGEEVKIDLTNISNKS